MAATLCMAQSTMDAIQLSIAKDEVAIGKFRTVLGDSVSRSSVAPTAVRTKQEIDGEMNALEREIDYNEKQLKSAIKKKNTARVTELNESTASKKTRIEELKVERESAPEKSSFVQGNDYQAAKYPEIQDIRANREKIVQMAPKDFDSTVREAVEKTVADGRDPGPIGREYVDIMFNGTEKTGGLYDRLMTMGREGRLNSDQMNWWKGIKTHLNGYGKTRWTRYDGQMFIETYHAADASTKSWLLRYAVPGVFGRVKAHPYASTIGLGIAAWGTYYFVNSSVGQWGFMLEESFQTSSQFSVPFYVTGADAQGDLMFENIETVKGIMDSWKTVHWLLNDTFLGDLFPSLNGVDAYLTDATSDFIKTKTQTLIERGIYKPSTANCFEMLNGEQYCVPEKSTEEERMDFLLANPGYLNDYSTEFKAKVLGQGQGGLCDNETGVCEGNIWAKKAGLTGQAALDIGKYGLVNVAERGAAGAFDDFGKTKSFLFSYNAAEDMTYDSLKATYGSQVDAINSGAAANTAAIWPDIPQQTNRMQGGAPSAVAPGTTVPGTTVPGAATGAFSIPDTTLNRAMLAKSGSDLVNLCDPYSGSGDKGQCKEFLNQFIKSDGSVDVNGLKALKQDLTYEQIAKLYGDNKQALKNGLKSMVATGGIQAVKDMIDAGVIEGSDAMDILPDNKKNEFELYNSDPKNFDAVITADGTVSWGDLTGYQHRESVVNSQKLVYNPSTGKWDSQIPATWTDTKTGASYNLDTSKYIDFLNKYGIKNVSQADLQSFLSTNPWICTYKCGSSSSGTMSKTSSGYSKSYTPYSSSGSYSGTKKTGIYFHANDVQADVYENDQLVGQTDAEIECEAGDHTFVIQKDGYKTRTITVNIYQNSMYNKYITLYKDSTADYSICTYVDDIGVSNLTMDHLVYVYALYKEWDDLAKEAKDKCDPQSKSLPSKVYHYDVLYVYCLLTGQTEAAQEMIDDGKVTCKEV